MSIDERGRAAIAAAPPMGGLSRRVPDGHRAVSVAALVPTGIGRGELVRIETADEAFEGTVAVAIRADPAFTATPGDRVQVWREPATEDAADSPAQGDVDTGEAAARTPEQVTTGELRAAVDDVATIAVDGNDAGRLRDDVRYRLVTLQRRSSPTASSQRCSATPTRRWAPWRSSPAASWRASPST